ncbi:hypothetical protein E2562_018257 [Oryza meyeriana var. granulata]|uniref:Reverse transcriptase domain-containing protein n=1 Tax=Oryza meyeriana var. granulata TaxID=110450 RepID=A0A6G1CR64_9ORYZ|nr:hypothetical protein E2562_018257 [Oryza meyeriana var. granulata]
MMHAEKELTISEHFRNIMSRPGPRTQKLNWQSLGIEPLDLAGLDDPFSEAEICKAIGEMPADKPLGLDGFTRRFFRAWWDIIKEDIVAAFKSPYDIRHIHSNLLNSANIVLIPKKEGADRVGDYRPISLIHGFPKIFSKVLFLILRPIMHSLISTNQSAFIHGRSIHDNFMYVRNTLRRYHKNKSPVLLFKLNISKGFDSMRWDYLLVLMQHWGFPQQWHDWITSLLTTSSSKILLTTSSSLRS